MQSNYITLRSSNFDDTIIISRCPESNCFLIPEKNIILKDGKDYIKYKCNKGHNGEIILNDYLINSKNKQLNSILCNYTNNHNNNNNNYAKKYCSKCDKFICNNCKLKHNLEKKEHILIPINKIDCYCLEHNESYVVYCNDCKKSSCNYCNNEPSNHNIEIIQRMKIEDKEIEKLEKKIQNIKIYLKKINELYNNILDKIKESMNKFNELNELEIRFIEDLISTYKYAEKNRQLNIEIIFNLKKNMDINEKNFESNIYNENEKKQTEYLIDNIDNYKVIKEKRIYE